jgi:hypothetical protein
MKALPQLRHRFPVGIYRIIRRHSSARSAIPKATDEDRKRVYILGGGNEGVFIGYNLASLPKPPPPTLLVQEPRRIEDFEKLGRK